jgi:prepilin-type N-terminal cleavage/methylation domain-containing protein
MRKERGFSLVELMVAMTVTLIVSSAIYGLLTSGSNAFRREPEIADRQQNIRAAMDIISRDVFAAGAGLPSFAQVFTRNDPGGGPCNAGLNGCGPAGTMGPVAAGARGGGGDLETTDVLEMVSTDEQCPVLGVCSTAVGDPTPGTAGPFVVQELVPACFRVPGLVVLANDNTFTLAAATAPGGGACTAGGVAGANGGFTLTGSLAPWIAAPPFPAQNQNPGANLSVYAYRARLARYRIANDPDPQDPVPSLWRTESGRYEPNGGPAGEPGVVAPGAEGSQWQLVARGIEDLQIEYLDGTGAWLNQPPVSTLNDWSSIVRQVRITLSARSSAPMLQGATRAAGAGPDAVRGQLTAVVTPRPAFQELQNCLSAGTPCPPASHIQ